MTVIIQNIMSPHRYKFGMQVITHVECEGRQSCLKRLHPFGHGVDEVPRPRIERETLQAQNLDKKRDLVRGQRSIDSQMYQAFLVLEGVEKGRQGIRHCARE